jgi:ubiquinone/menaquinone biosynthesis C-methylase UbiE
VDDPLVRGHREIIVLDVSQAAIDMTKKRLGKTAQRENWITGAVTEVPLEADAYDVWHDRAVFRFLVNSAHRMLYVRQVARAVRPGSLLI